MKLIAAALSALLLTGLLPAQDTAASVSTPSDSTEDTESYTIEKPANVETEDSLAADRFPAEAASETLTVRTGAEIATPHRARTALLSLLVPGLGEYRMGKKALGKSLMLADGLCWAGLGVSFVLRSLIKDDLRAYLFTYGDCRGDKSISGRSAWDLNDHELELPLYADSSAYYEERIFKPSRDPSMLKVDYYWQWDSEEHHQRYYDIWTNMNTAKVTGYYFLGSAVLFRAGSYVYARYLAKNVALHADKAEPIPIVLRPVSTPNGLCFVLSGSF